MDKYILNTLKLYLIVLLPLDWAYNEKFVSGSFYLIIQLIPLILFILLIANHKLKIYLDNKIIIFWFILLVFLSSIVNNVNIYALFINIRWLLLPYFIYLIIINLNLQEFDLKKNIKFIYIMAIIQIPLAVYKYFILNWPGEKPLGLIGHSYSTPFVLLFFSGVIAYFFNYKRKIKTLLLLLGIIIITIASGKRAIVFFIPIVIITYLYLNKNKFINQVKITIISLLIIIPALYIISRANPSLNPDNRVWGSFNIDYTINYVFNYTSTNRLGVNNRIANRSVATIYINDMLTKSPVYFLLGFGGDKFTKSKNKNASLRDKLYDLEYGINGLTWLAYQFGYPAALLWFWFFLSFFKTGKKISSLTESSFWISFGQLISLASFILSFIVFLYAPDYKSLVFVSYVYFLLALSTLFLKNPKAFNKIKVL